MDDLRTGIESLLANLKPLLKEAGRDIVLVEATPERARFKLEGFCTDCACGEEYRDGIREVVQGNFPALAVEFE